MRFERADGHLAWENGTAPAKIDVGGINYEKVTRVTDSSVRRHGGYVYGVTSTMSFEVSLRRINSTRLFIYSPARDTRGIIRGVSADVETSRKCAAARQLQCPRCVKMASRSPDLCFFFARTNKSLVSTLVNREG